MSTDSTNSGGTGNLTGSYELMQHEFTADNIKILSLSSDSEYLCRVTVRFFEKNFTKEVSITTDYDGKYNAYFCFIFHIFLENLL